MELNAEQIKKALECCTLGDCAPCPYRKTYKDCRDKMAEDALSLINSQEQRIKELTKENERLRAIPEQMKERLQAYFGTYVLGYKIPITEALKAVNQIAKEMLEGEK